jgi:RNA recognition motif-containing protein
MASTCKPKLRFPHLILGEYWPNERNTDVNNILVGNLGLNVTEQDIRPLFEKHGRVQRFKMMTDRWTGLPRGFGFIQMKTDAAAEEAIVALNGTALNGKALKVNHARPQLHRKKTEAKNS